MARQVERFEDLDVYKRSCELQQAVFAKSMGFPPAEKYSLTDQIRRSSRSIGANIAEAWAKRLYPDHFRSKLSDADAEQMETQHWLRTSHSCGYVPTAEFDSLLSDCRQIGAMLGKMMQNAASWRRCFKCKPSVHRLPTDTDHCQLSTVD